MSAPATSYEARHARDDARRIAEELRRGDGGDRGDGSRLVTKRCDGDDTPDRAATGRVADLLAMLGALLDERIDRAIQCPSGRCEYCGHSPDHFDYDEVPS